MNTSIREYTDKDKPELVRCMEALQDFEIGIDNLKRKRRLLGFGKDKTNKLLKRIAKKQGKIFLAIDGKSICGCVAGAIEKQTKEDLLKNIPSRVGWILELYIDEAYRNHGIGRQLIQRMEKYFKTKRCTLLYINVMTENNNAHGMYKHLGYADRYIQMIKQIT